MPNSPTNTHLRVFSIAQYLLLLGLWVGVLWLAVDNRRLREHVAALRSDTSGLGADMGEQASTIEKLIVRATEHTIAMKAGFEQQSAMLDKLSIQVDQQTAVVHRALGTVIPVVLPPDWEQRMAALEAQIHDITKWPKDEQEAEDFVDRTSELIRSLPAWAESDYLPRITVLRWAAMALGRIRNTPDDDALASAADETLAIANAAPDSPPEALLKELRKLADELAAKHDAVQLQQAITVANIHISGGAANDQDLAAADAYEVLMSHEIADAKAAEADAANAEAEKLRELRSQLRISIVKAQATSNAKSFSEQWDRIRPLKDTQPAVYETFLQMMLSELMIAKVALAMEGVSGTAYDDLDRVLRHALSDAVAQNSRLEEDRQAKAIREYQRWALKEVTAFESTFNAAKEAADKYWRAYKIGFNEGWTDAQYKEVRDAIVAHLLPINQQMLDLPVQQRYHRAFDLGWKKLDGREDQTHVAEQSALAEKKPLRDFLEK